MVACILVCRICGKYKPFSSDQREYIELAVNKRNIWIRSSIVWFVIDNWLSLNSILTTILVLYLSCFNQNEATAKQKIFFYSSISLFCAICPYVLKTKNNSMAYRDAYREVASAILGGSDLKSAIIRGEDIIKKAHT